MLKLSACTGCYGHEDLFQIIDRVAELGFDGVEITVAYHTPPSETSPQRLREIERHVRGRGLEVGAVHFIFKPGFSFVSEDPDERRRLAGYLGQVAEMAAELPAPVVMVGGGGIRSIPEGLDRAVGEDRVLGVLEGVAERCATLGVTIAFEALNRYESNLGNTLADCRRLVDRLGSPWVRVGGDTFHMNIEERSLGEAIVEAGSSLAHLHLADSHRLAPGDGHVDFRAVLAALRQIDYRGHASFELFAIAPGLWYLPTHELCDEQVSRAIRHIRAIDEALGGSGGSR